MRVQSALYVLAIALALLLLVIVLAFGAIVAITCRDRRPGFSYFGAGIPPKVKDF